MSQELSTWYSLVIVKAVESMLMTQYNRPSRSRNSSPNAANAHPHSITTSTHSLYRARVKTNYVLIDYENVQPEAMAGLCEDHFKVLVFVGENQSKVTFEVASALQQMGELFQTRAAEIDQLTGALQPIGSMGHE